jgi:hypothetical protein
MRRRMLKNDLLETYVVVVSGIELLEELVVVVVVLVSLSVNTTAHTQGRIRRDLRCGSLELGAARG